MKWILINTDSTFLELDSDVNNKDVFEMSNFYFNQIQTMMELEINLRNNQWKLNSTDIKYMPIILQILHVKTFNIK